MLNCRASTLDFEVKIASLIAKTKIYNIAGKFGKFTLFEHLAKKFGKLTDQRKGY